jgi:tRNA(Ile)-lysidine synthase
MSPVGAALADFLRRHAPVQGRQSLCIALSGGVDSTALLLAAVELRERATSPADPGDAPPPAIDLRAVHVDHGLQAAATRWGAHCARLCASRSVPFELLRANVALERAHGLEAAAREARYAALAARLRPGEWLLTAHHADDQLETVLIQLLRGAGLPGLAAMPEVAPLGAGRHGRPLRALGRAELAALVSGSGIDPIEDPMNDDARFDRGYLRRRVLPALRARWPRAATTVARSARHCATAQALLEECARQDAQAAIDGPRLRLAPLAPLDARRRANVLRWWLGDRGLAVPSSQRLEQLVAQMWSVAPDRQPLVRWRGGEVRRYRGRLYALPSPPPALGPSSEFVLRPGAVLALGAGLGTLTLRATTGRGLAADRCARGLRVAGRAGGEEIRVHAGGPRRPLRLLLQEAGIPPWRRDALPLLWAGGELLAVADRWISADHGPAPDETGYLPEWSDAPPLD